MLFSCNKVFDPFHATGHFLYFLKILVFEQFPDWKVPRLTTPRQTVPDTDFPDRTVLRQNNFLTRHFPHKTFFRLDIFLIDHLPFWTVPRLIKELKGQGYTNSSSYKHNMQQVLHYNIVYFLRYTHRDMRNVSLQIYRNNEICLVNFLRKIQTLTG